MKVNNRELNNPIIKSLIYLYLIPAGIIVVILIPILFIYLIPVLILGVIDQLIGNKK